MGEEWPCLLELPRQSPPRPLFTTVKPALGRCVPLCRLRPSCSASPPGGLLLTEQSESRPCRWCGEERRHACLALTALLCQ